MSEPLKSHPISDGVQPDGWRLFLESLTGERPLLTHYKGKERFLSPHVLGWHDSQALALVVNVYAHSDRPPDWRHIYLSQLSSVATADDQPWNTLPDYTGPTETFDRVAAQLPAPEVGVVASSEPPPNEGFALCRRCGRGVPTLAGRITQHDDRAGEPCVLAGEAVEHG